MACQKAIRLFESLQESYVRTPAPESRAATPIEPALPRPVLSLAAPPPPTPLPAAKKVVGVFANTRARGCCILNRDALGSRRWAWGVGRT